MSISVSSLEAIKLARADHPIHDLIARRWSPRGFADRPVEAAKLRSMLEAARWAASSGNGQPWSFVVATRQDPEPFQRMVNCLSQGNVPWASRVPVLMITVAKLTRASGAPNRHAFYDVALAVQNLAIQALALDVYVHQMGGFSPETARELFHIPEDHEAVTMLAAGYLGDAGTLPERNRERELAPRERRPLSDFVFGADWGGTSPLLNE